MTNYEWLCKENKLVEFLDDISNSSVNDISEKWHINVNSAFWLEDVRDWLQSEHKATKWVRLDEVLKAFNRGNVRLILSDINKLETKEIEDEV